jgi:hypothetical protein
MKANKFIVYISALLAIADQPISGEVYAWAAVFILPVNSALNPILYTLSAILGGKVNVFFTFLYIILENKSKSSPYSLFTFIY